MTYGRVLRTLYLGLAGSMTFAAASVQSAELKGDIKVTEADKTVYSSPITLIVDKATEIQAGPYKVVVTPSLMPDNLVRLTYNVTGGGLHPSGGGVMGKLGTFKLFNGGLQGDRQIEITLH